MDRHRPLIRYPATAVAILLAIPLFAIAQDATPGANSLTYVWPVIVSDVTGKPITGLTKSDFVASGAQILSVEEVDAASLPSTEGAASQPATYILFDDLRAVSATSGLQPLPLGQCGAPIGGETLCPSLGGSLPEGYYDTAADRKELIRFLAHGVETGRNYEVLVPGVGFVHRITTPLPLLAAALKNLNEQTHVLQREFSTTGSVQDPRLLSEETERLKDFLEGKIWTGDNPQDKPRTSGKETLQLRSLVAIADLLRAVPGRKALVWLTTSTHEFHGPLLTKAFVDARVSVYPALIGGARIFENESTVEGTGGKWVSYRTGPASAISVAIADCGPYYLVHLRLSSRNAYDSTTLNVNRPGTVTVRK